MSSERDVVLTAAQLLWVKCIMDTFAALAFLIDRPTRDVLRHFPPPKKALLIDYQVGKMVLGQATYQLAVLLTLQYAGSRVFGSSIFANRSHVRSVVFNTFVWMQIFNVIK